jgi:hypothetical protein
MKKHFTEFLIEQGYKTYNFIVKSDWNPDAKRQAQRILNENPEGLIFKKGDYNSKGSSFYVPIIFNTIYLQANYNVMKNGGTCVRFIKDDIEIIYGLSELGNPPTLISPRPRIKMKSNIFDEPINKCLSLEKNEDIYKALFDSEIVFSY